MPLPDVDTKRIEAELVADADLLRSLCENGDVPDVVRPVDVRFIGSAPAIAALADGIRAEGWDVLQRVGVDGGEEALDVQRRQATEPDAVRRLTEAALRTEARYGVRYDGWGTVAATRLEPEAPSSLHGRV